MRPEVRNPLACGRGSENKLLLLIVAVVAPAYAQNGHSANYDDTREVKISGPVTQIQWFNPHAFLFINQKEPGGTVLNWAIDIGNPLDLERGGWKSTTVRIGDVLTVKAEPARGDRHQALAKTITRAGEASRPLFVLPSSRPTAASKEPAPRWPDGQVRLGPAPGKKGYWAPAGANALIERSSTPIPMNEEGLLRNLGDIDRVAPLQPWARAIYEYRQRNLLKDDPFLRCLPPGGPRQFQVAHGFQFIEQRELGRILVLHGGGDRNWRVIYTDGRPQGQADEVVRSFYGNSVGHWENKDTLTVDTIGFNEKFWFTNGGLPHTEALHLIERFTRPDLRTLKYEVTVDDPNTYTRQWTGGWNIQWVSDQDIQEYFCEENAESILRH